MNRELEIGQYFLLEEGYGWAMLVPDFYEGFVYACLDADGVWCFWLDAGETANGDPMWRSITRAQYEALALRGEEP